MPRTTTRPDKPGERGGRPQLTRDGYARLERRAPGDTVPLTVWRGGASRKLSVQLAAGE